VGDGVLSLCVCVCVCVCKSSNDAASYGARSLHDCTGVLD